MSLIVKLPNRPLDIIGDVHGEIDALNTLLNRLGYSESGDHPEKRFLVFSGDLCDRGPDSIAVIEKVKSLIEAGNAVAVAGNHELNILTENKKDGCGWFYSDCLEPKYDPCRKAKDSEKEDLFTFLNSLPIGAERDDIQICHAYWHEDSIKKARNTENTTLSDFYFSENNRLETLYASLKKKHDEEMKIWGSLIKIKDAHVPFNHGIAEWYKLYQMENATRVICSGSEEIETTPFFVGERWKFTRRTAWWETDPMKKTTVIGHYWRKAENDPKSEMFSKIGPYEWFGLNKNVFCIDYSVGKRFQDRLKKQDNTTHLGCLRWPERTLMFETGETKETSF